METSNSPNIPLLFDGDAYLLTVEPVSPSLVCLTRVLRYDNNVNTDATCVRFFDLSPQCKQAIIQQINRRFRGKTVKV